MLRNMMHNSTTSTFLLAVILGNPLPSTTSDPINQSRPSQQTTTSSETEDLYRTSKSTRPSFRIAKAIGVQPQTNTAVVPDRQQQSITTIGPLSSERGSTIGVSVQETVELNFRGNVTNTESFSTQMPSQHPVESIDRIRNATAKKDSKITWILTNKSRQEGRSKYDQEVRNQSSAASRNASLEEVEDLTVLPLQEEISKIDLMLANRTRSSFATSLSAVDVAGSNAAIRTFNRSEDEVEFDEEIAQTQHFATAASILEGKESQRRTCHSG